jgi:hypothetical protein
MGLNSWGTAGIGETWPSNKPFEWTGHLQLSATPPQAPCLPLKGSVRFYVNPSWAISNRSPLAFDVQPSFDIQTSALLNQGMNDNLGPIQKLVWV